MELKTLEDLGKFIRKHECSITSTFNEKTDTFGVFAVADNGLSVFGSGVTLEQALLDFDKSQEQLDKFVDLQTDTKQLFLGDDFGIVKDDDDDDKTPLKQRKFMNKASKEAYI